MNDSNTSITEKKYTIDNGYIVQSSVQAFDSELALKIRQNLMEEYRISSNAESMIIDLAVSAYIRHLECSRVYTNLLGECKIVHEENDDGEIEKKATFSYSFDQLKINLLKEMGKQVNMAEQQYLTLISFLNESRRPPIKVNIKTDQAFVAENQQFNKNA